MPSDVADAGQLAVLSGALGPSGDCIRPATTCSADLGRLGVRQPSEAVVGDRGDHREDLPGKVGAAGGRVVVGRVVQRLHAAEDRVGDGHVVAVELLQRAPGEDRARPDRVVAVLLVRAARHVVAEDPADPGLLVVPGEQRDDGEALHGRAEVVPDHLGEPVGLALERERAALHLLVVLELDLEEPDELKPHRVHAGDRHRGELVAPEHLVHVPLGDHVPGGRPAVARHHDAALADRGHDRGGVGQVLDHLVGDVAAGETPAAEAGGQQVRLVRRRGSQ